MNESHAKADFQSLPLTMQQYQKSHRSKLKVNSWAFDSSDMCRSKRNSFIPSHTTPDKTVKITFPTMTRLNTGKTNSEHEQIAKIIKDNTHMDNQNGTCYYTEN
jgi:hypothetical protein